MARDPLSLTDTRGVELHAPWLVSGRRCSMVIPLPMVARWLASTLCCDDRNVCRCRCESDGSHDSDIYLQREKLDVPKTRHLVTADRQTGQAEIHDRSPGCLKNLLFSRYAAFFPACSLVAQLTSTRVTSSSDILMVPVVR